MLNVNYWNSGLPSSARADRCCFSACHPQSLTQRNSLLSRKLQKVQGILRLRDASLSYWFRIRKGWNQHAHHTAISISWGSQETVIEYLSTFPNLGAPTAKSPYHWVPTRSSSSWGLKKIKSRLIVGHLRSNGTTKHLLWYRRSERRSGKIQRM